MPMSSPVRSNLDTHRNDIKVPYPLPMPAYGGYFAPLLEFLPENLQPSAGFHRYDDCTKNNRNLFIELEDKCIQNFHLWIYVIGFKVTNSVLWRHAT